MKKILLTILFINFTNFAFSSIKDDVINSLIKTENFSFNFEQNINGKVQTGNCIIEYPKKIFCKYNKPVSKILVSNGNSLVIKINSSGYYRYAIKNTPLNYILDKNFLINEIKSINERIVDNKFINFTIFKDGNEINIFFDKDNYNLIGWQTLDIYQNLNITFITSLKKNLVLKKNVFKLPPVN